MGNLICMPWNQFVRTLMLDRCTACEKNCQHQSDTCRVLALSEEDRTIVSDDIEERSPAWNTADMDTECTISMERTSERIVVASHNDSLEVLDRSEEDEPMASVDLEGHGHLLTWTSVDMDIRLIPMASVDMDMECTICMEPISEGTILPCQCKLHYCLSCWDKALANSFSQRGQPTCPSCRTLVRADFDAEKNRLVFSTEAIDMTFAAQRELAEKLRQALQSQKPGASLSAEEVHEFHKFVLDHDEFHKFVLDHGEMRQGTIERLRHQASPVQVKLLQHYGKTNPSLLEVHGNAREVLKNSSISELKTFLQEAGVDRSGCLEKSDLVNQLVENSHSSRISSLWASQQCSPPKCVCGCSFSLVSGLDRFKMMIKDDRDSLSAEAIELALQQRVWMFVVCDICESSVPLGRNSRVWTCENRTSSILHATSYDICETCFVQSACVR